MGARSGISVKAIDFSAWLAETVTLDDYVVCKVDAEGSEYELVQRLLADGTLCLCDRLAVEWHAWIGPLGQPRQDFNDPSKYNDRFDERACLGDVACVCQTKVELPYFYCGLPRIVEWARAACAPAPYLEHHEFWWPGIDVGRETLVRKKQSLK